MGGWFNRGVFDSKFGSEELNTVLSEGIVIMSPVEDNSDESL
jgi:hypothetical protein